MAGSSSPGGPEGGVPTAPSTADLGWEPTVTSGGAPPAAGGGGAPGGPGTSPAAEAAQSGPPAVAAGGTASAADAGQVVRHGPGVPAGLAAGQAAPTAEQVWQAGPPGAAPRGQRARLIAGSVLSVALLIASVVVIFLRLHHGPFGVTGVAIAGQQKTGCTVNVTGRISTTGAAGTVSYEWIFAAQQAAPQPMSQSAAAGQSAVYVTAAIQGQGHGSLAQTVTLRVLGPGHGNASVPVTVSC